MVDGRDAEFGPDGVPGRAIVRTSWTGIALFAATTIPAALGVDAFDTASVVVALTLFFLSLFVWTYTFYAAFARSANGDHIAVGNLFLIEGDVPRAVRRALFGACIVCLVVTGATASPQPFAVLVPMWPLGFVGLWGARHGVFGLRRDVAEGRAPVRRSTRRNTRP